MPCTPNPDPDRPYAQHLVGEGSDARVAVRAKGQEQWALWRDVAYATSAELPVGGCVGMRAGDASLYDDVADDVELAEENYRALQRMMALVSAKGGGKVLIPDRRDPALRSATNPQGFVPFCWHGPIAIPEGVELVIDGLEAERYVRLRGDRHGTHAVEIVENPPPTTDPPTPEQTYAFAHGLVVRPAYWEPAVWLKPDGSRVELATRLKAAEGEFEVTFPAGALQAGDIGQTAELWVRATVGRPG